MLRLNRIAKRRAGVSVLDNLSFQVGRGECVAVTGGSDVSVSALMQIAATLMPPDSGSLLIDGIDAVREPFAARPRLAYIAAGSMPVRPGLQLSDAWTTWHAGHAIATTSAPGTFLKQTGIHRHARVNDLSVSEQRRVAVALALDSSAPVVLLDKPFSGLDDNWTERVANWITSARDAGAAILVSGDTAASMSSLATRVVHIEP